MAAAAACACDALPAFNVEGKIGEGTFGEVFLIRHARRRERVFALKKNKARVWFAATRRSAAPQRPRQRSAAACAQRVRSAAC